MNTLLLHPTDVLFFRDGRPMSGSLAGHGAAWPMPNVVNAALHAALHRAGLDSAEGLTLHTHRRGGRGVYTDERERKFGSLLTAGPFPVRTANDQSTWYFPRPLDLQDATLTSALLPARSVNCAASSLPPVLKYAVANRLAPSKDSKAKAWLSQSAFNEYLGAGKTVAGDVGSAGDADFSDAESAIGIGIDPDRQVQDGEMFYSAHYLRLRDDWRLGLCASAEDRDFKHPTHGNDLVKALLDGGRGQMIVGGQQRVCSAMLVEGAPIPLPRGKVAGFTERDGKSLVKWVLLSPAVWPAIKGDGDRGLVTHPGGWLPNWVDASSGKILLKARDTTRGAGEPRPAWRERVRSMQSPSGRLVAAIVPKPVVVTGWSLGETVDGLNKNQGAKSVHLAAPAGAIYYFEADTPGDARALAAALNWHGADPNPITIKNRRSALLGEKGFGLGLCGTWDFYENVGGRPRSSECPATKR